MNKVETELEALQECKENQLKVEFLKDRYLGREYVIVSKGFHKVAGKTLIDAINRLVELKQTRPIDHEKLAWYEESQKYIDGIR